MSEWIEIRGARVNNLKDVSLRIPKRRITIFTGVSGSGKSSIVFDTIATEAQRQLYENFSLFVRSFLPRYPPPEADAIRLELRRLKPASLRGRSARLAQQRASARCASPTAWR